MHAWDMAAEDPSDDLATVLRWEASGGDVEVVHWGPPLVLDLLTCDGGQRMQQLTSDAEDLRRHLHG